MPLTQQSAPLLARILAAHWLKTAWTADTGGDGVAGMAASSGTYRVWVGDLPVGPHRGWGPPQPRLRKTHAAQPACGTAAALKFCVHLIISVN